MKELEIKYQSSKTIMKNRTIDFNNQNIKKPAWIEQWTTYNIGDSPLTLAQVLKLPQKIKLLKIDEK